MTDTSTNELTADEIVAHLRDHPEDADSVATVEERRDSPRVTVLRAVDAARAATSVAPSEARPYPDAMTDAYKAELVAAGYAEGEGASFRITNPAAVPGWSAPDEG